MAGRPRQPIDLLVMNGKSHLGKDEIEERRAAVLVSYAGDFFYDGPHRAWINDQGFTLVNFLQYLNYVAVTSVFLFIGTYVRNRNWHLRCQLDEVRAVNAMLEQYQKNNEERAEETGEAEKETVCRFEGATANAVLEVRPSDIIYVESMANYADVWYMEANGAKAYLVNTGWNGTGKRISIKDTRGIIDAILNGDINKAPTKKLPYFDFEIPTELTGYATHVCILNEDGTIRKMVAAHDVGRVVNRKSLEGQIEGGTIMGCGYALTEQYPLDHCKPTAKFGTLGLFRADKADE